MSHIIQGRLIDIFENPIGDASVMLVGGPSSFMEIAVITNISGLFQLSAGQEEGIYRLAVHREDVLRYFDVELPQQKSVETLIWN